MPADFLTLGNILQFLMIAFIVGTVIYLARRNGAANPVSTGGLDRKLETIGGELAGVKTKVGEIEDRVEKIDSRAASAADIQRLEKQIAQLGQTLPDIEARQRALSDKMGEHSAQASSTATKVDHINRQVDLIYQVLVTKGMEK